MEGGCRSSNWGVSQQQLGGVAAVEGGVALDKPYLNLGIFPFKERVTHLDFTKTICEAKLKANPEVLIVDCTYKSNKYYLPLLNVAGTIYLNTTFYAAFGFLLQEISSGSLRFFEHFIDDWILRI